MRRLIVLVVPIVVVLAGCNRFAGPLEVRRMDRADARAPDGLPYTIEQQEARGRERYSIPDDDFRAGPRIGFGAVDPIWRGTP